MKLPKDLSGADLIQALKKFGYAVTRQSGSHIRLSTEQGGQHHLTVPNHSSLRVGTLASILSEVADHHKLTREDVCKKLFL